MLVVLALAFAGIFFICWFGCLFCYAKALRHRLPGVNPFDLGLWFKLNEEGARYRHLGVRFLIGGFISFTLSILLLMLSGA